MEFLTATAEPVSRSEILRHLELFGVLYFRHATEAGLRSVMSEFSDPYRHPHDDLPGITRITPRSSPPMTGGRGFSHAELLLHTDRSLTTDPPALLASLMVSGADSGGVSTFADGREVLRRLAERGPSGLETLRLGGTSVWSQHQDRHRLRYRDDEVARPSCPADPTLPGHLRRVLTETCFVREFRPGEGYLLHNHRVLHGRTAFTGPREIVRVLADVAPRSPYARLNDGFSRG